MFESSAKRVSGQTASHLNRRIASDLEESVRSHAAHPDRIEERLRELDQEWDVERMLEANAATVALAGLALASTVDRRWLVLPALVGGFLLQHAVQGWCPPLPVLRRLGFRTMEEIHTERYALKALRGDFGPIGPDNRDHDSRASHALQAARL